ncbi:MAG: AAA family ATPase [Atopobiaceae bacterium]|nr:AAA family ATPase [Atopobiaceae bacterium]
MNNNPFTPTFGIVPPHLAGRKDILEQMSDAFSGDIGNPNLSTILIGARGCGKTALLSCIANEARKHGWIAVTVVATEGMLEDIYQRTLEASAEHINQGVHKHLTGIEIAQLLGIEWTYEEQAEGNWRTRMNTLLSELGDRGIGLAIHVDEVDASVEEMIQLASTYQLFIGEGRRVSLIMAGLPKHTLDLMDNERVSFLRRARQRRIGSVSDAEVLRAFLASIEDAGKSIGATALQQAVNATCGYPYMMQLIGYCAWESSRNSKEITKEHVEQGITQAASEFRAGVLDATFRDMSKGDRAFARAMIACGNECTLTNVAKEMGKQTNYASTYKSRLLKQGVITEMPDGSFDFALPMLKDYLAEKL